MTLEPLKPQNNFTPFPSVNQPVALKAVLVLFFFLGISHPLAVEMRIVGCNPAVVPSKRKTALLAHRNNDKPMSSPAKGHE